MAIKWRPANLGWGGAGKLTSLAPGARALEKHYENISSEMQAHSSSGARDAKMGLEKVTAQWSPLSCGL